MDWTKVLVGWDSGHVYEIFDQDEINKRDERAGLIMMAREGEGNMSQQCMRNCIPVFCRGFDMDLVIPAKKQGSGPQDVLSMHKECSCTCCCMNR